MAKIAYSKLNLKNNRSQVIEREWVNDIVIEVKTYLPVEEMADLVSRIVNFSVDTNGYYNPIRIQIYLLVETFLACTNVNVTEKQKEDIYKLYDDLKDSEIYKIVPLEIYQEVLGYTNTLIHSIYEYKNSVYGILDGISSDYSDLNFEVDELYNKLADKENLSVVRDVLTKLG